MKKISPTADTNLRQQRKPSFLFNPVMEVVNFLPEQMKRSTPFSLFPPVQLFCLAAVCIAGAASAQCYVDPYSGQRSCTKPAGTCPPTASSNASNVTSFAHCRIRVGDGTLGSGTLVNRDESVGLILTCSHLFNCDTSQIVATFPKGESFAAKLVEIDRANDLAVVAIQRPNIEPLAIGDGEASGTLAACGFGPNGMFRSIVGNITGHVVAVGATFPSLTLSCAVRPGDSGGAVLDSSGNVVGVVWGQRDGQTYATCGKPVREFVHRVLAKIFGQHEVARPIDQDQKQSQAPTPPIPSPTPPAPSPTPDWQAFTNELESRIRALDAKKQDKGDYLQHGDLNGYVRGEELAKVTGPLALRSEIEAKLGTLSSRFESVHSVVQTVEKRVEEITSDRDGFLKGVSMGKVAVGALGLSGPLAVAVIAAGGWAGWRVKSRLQRLESRLALDARPSPLDLQTIAVDSPPPPQRSVPETHYVPIEKDTFAKAHQWASEHVARKYPGATEVLQAQDSLIKQFLAGR